MKLSNAELTRIYRGALFFEETADGYLQAFQYTRPQMEYFKAKSDFLYDRCMASSAKTLEFTTEAEELAFEYKIIWMGSPDTFEVAVDGLIAHIWYVKDLPEEGSLRLRLPAGKKEVTVYLPVDATVLLRGFECDAPVAALSDKTEKVLWLGDSITMGFGPLRSAQTYVSVVNRLLRYDPLNQAIGGYVYDKGSLMRMEGYTPHKIIVALGTNQYGAETMDDVEDFYDALMGIYGEAMPVLCISPLWRGDSPEGIPKLLSFCENVKRIAGSYKNVKVVDGLELVPHLPEYFLDKLHPNSLGMEVYGRNLVEAIRRIGF